MKVLWLWVIWKPCIFERSLIPQWQFNDECCSFALSALHADQALVQFNDFTAEVKTDPEACYRADLRILDPVVAFKNFLLVFARDSYALLRFLREADGLLEALAVSVNGDALFSSTQAYFWAKFMEIEHLRYKLIAKFAGMKAGLWPVERAGIDAKISSTGALMRWTGEKVNQIELGSSAHY